MDNNRVTAKVTLKLDEKWASRLNKDELIDELKIRLNTSLGFRGQVKRVSLRS